MARNDKSSRQHAPATTDTRFARLHTDPRFLKPQREASKVTVDDRFKGLLDGNDFGINKRSSKVDRFGRKTKKGTASKEEEEMKRLYRLERAREAAGSEEEEEATDEEDDEEDSDEDDGEEKPFIDYARGAADLDSSGESSSEEEDEDDESGSSEEDDDPEATVAIGNAAVLRRERRRQRAARGSGDDDEDDSLSDDVDLEEIQNLDSKDLAVLDAQAALYNDQDEAGPSSRVASSSKSKQKRPKKDAIPMGDETKRLAVVNMDWDHVRSLDLYKVFSSLVSPLATRLPGSSTQEEEGSRKKASIQVRGTVESVRIYPSEFGRERMQREDREGPPKDIFKSESNGDSHSKKKKKSSKKGKGKSRQEDDDSSDESDFAFEVNDGGEFDEEALRKYQLDRLRYYYAVATFDSAEAARHVYDEVDGTEMERTANLFDLRFVPGGMEFPEHQGDDGWRDEAKPGADDGIAYKGLDWATDALRHSKVKLTWDAPDPERQKITRRAASSMTKDQIRDEDFKAYLASDSEGEEDDNLAEAEANGQRNAAGGAGRDRFRSLLGLDDENNAFTSKKKNRSSAFEDARDDEDGGGDMQITFLPGLSEAAARKASGTKEDGEETTLEKYLRKQREKKAAKKAGKTNGVVEDAEEAQTAVAAGNDDIGFDDPFFASGGEEEDIDFDAMLAKDGQPSKSSKTKDQKKKQNKTVTKEDSPVEPSLPLPDEEEDDGRHFDMKDILKAEAKQGKKLNRWERKKLLKAERAAARKNGEDADPTIAAAKIKTKTPVTAPQDDFKMDLSDSRFGALLNPEGDHEYALDPSHPSFLKTKNMKKLMEEKRKRSSAALLADEEELGGAKKRKAVVEGGEDGDAVAMLRDLKKRQATTTTDKNGSSSKKGRR